MSTSEAATAVPVALNAIPIDKSKPVVSSTCRENSTSLTALLAELQLHQVVKTLWRINSHELIRFDLTPSHCVVEAVRSKNQTLKLSWGDVLGAHVLTADGEHVKTSVDNLDTVAATTPFFLSIFACICSSHRPNTLKTRTTREFSFKFDKKQLQQVLQLQRTINFVADPRNYATVQKVTTLDELEILERPQRKFLVLLNPVSGPGKRKRERAREFTYGEVSF